MRAFFYIYLTFRSKTYAQSRCTTGPNGRSTRRTEREEHQANRATSREPNERSHQRTEQPAGNRAQPSRPCVLRLCAFVVRSSSLVGCFVLRARLVPSLCAFVVRSSSLVACLVLRARPALGAREFRAPWSCLCAFVLCFPPRSSALPPPCSCRPCACARSSSASLLVPRLSLLRARLARAGSRAEGSAAPSWADEGLCACGRGAVRGRTRGCARADKGLTERLTERLTEGLTKGLEMRLICVKSAVRPHRQPPVPRRTPRPLRPNHISTPNQVRTNSAPTPLFELPKSRSNGDFVVVLL